MPAVDKPLGYSGNPGVNDVSYRGGARCRDIRLAFRVVTDHTALSVRYAVHTQRVSHREGRRRKVRTPPCKMYVSYREWHHAHAVRILQGVTRRYNIGEQQNQTTISCARIMHSTTT
jgi:hypothetical protein